MPSLQNSKTEKIFKSSNGFKNFVVVVITFLACSSPTTVSSLVDSLHLAPSSYESLIKFFRIDSWNLEAVNDYLIRLVAQYAPLYPIGDRNVLVGDGCKTPKQGKKLPTLKKMFIESEDVSKPNGFTPGLHFGAISLIGKVYSQLFSFPIFARLITGNKEVAQDNEQEDLFGIMKMAHDLFRITLQLGQNCLGVLDRFYLSQNLLALWRENNAKYPNLLHFIVRAKMNLKIWRPYTGEKPKSRGRPKTKEMFSLRSFFDSKRNEFQEIEACDSLDNEKLSDMN